MKNQSIIRKPRENLQNIFSFSVLIWMGQSEHLRWGQIRFCFGFFVGSDVWRPTFLSNQTAFYWSTLILKSSVYLLKFKI